MSFAPDPDGEGRRDLCHVMTSTREHIEAMAGLHLDGLHNERVDWINRQAAAMLDHFTNPPPPLTGLHHHPDRNDHHRALSFLFDREVDGVLSWLEHVDPASALTIRQAIRYTAECADQEFGMPDWWLANGRPLDE